MQMILTMYLVYASCKLCKLSIFTIVITLNDIIVLKDYYEEACWVDCLQLMLVPVSNLTC